VQTTKFQRHGTNLVRAIVLVVVVATGSIASVLILIVLNFGGLCPAVLGVAIHTACTSFGHCFWNSSVPL
jgi:hypothetical protein